MVSIGSRVKVKESLTRGMGVCREQLEYKGKCFTVAVNLGYAVMLEGNDFVWNLSDLEVM